MTPSNYYVSAQSSWKNSYSANNVGLIFAGESLQEKCENSFEEVLASERLESEAKVVQPWHTSHSIHDC